MTLATLGPVSSNFIVTGFALCAVFAFVIGAVVWAREGQLDDHDDELARHDEQLATLAYQMPKLLEFLGIEIPAPVVDDSPEALEAEEDATYKSGDEINRFDADPATDEIPVQPGIPTEPMAVVNPTPAVQARRAAAWDEQRPSPVPRGKSAEWVEDELAKIRARIDAAQGA